MIELEQILVGTLPNDKTGDPLRNAFQKINANMVTLTQYITELENGVGTSDYPEGTQVLIRDTRDITNTTGALHVFGGVQIDKNAYIQESLFIGTGSNVSELTEPVFIARRDGAQFIQGIIINNSAFGSSDYVAQADTGDDEQGFADMGFTGSLFNDPNYTFTGPGDGYFIVQGLDDGLSHGELHLATGDIGTTKDIVFSTGGYSIDTERMRYVHNDQLLRIKGDLETSGKVAPGNTLRGFINLVGDRPNNEDDCWFESVVVRGDYAYALGGDWYIDNSSRRSKVYKFNLVTGEQELVRQIDAGRDAAFDLSITAGVVSIDAIANAGTGYVQNEKIYIRGDQIGGSVPLNDITINVATVNGTGGILTASIVAGYNANGLSGTYSYITSYNNGATGYPIAISFDDNNNRLIVVSGYEAGRGDSMDNYWDWANVYTLNPTNFNIISVQTLSDAGDIYPNSIITHPSGKVAIVGEKYNEYREFGNLTILGGGNGYFNILKSNLDPEHYPGTSLPGEYVNDYWITGTGIPSQENVDGVNYYTQLPTTTNGSGTNATFYTNYDNTTGITTFLMDAPGTGYIVGDIVTCAGTNFAGGTSPANNVTATVGEVDGAGGIISATFNTTNFPTNALRIRVDNVDFSGVGTWAMRQNLGGEAFVWTPTWSKAIGGATADKFYGTCFNQDGSAIYAVGRGRYETTYDQALVVKYNSTTGAIAWSKDIKFTEAGTENRQARAVCVVPNSTDILVAGEWYNNESQSDEIILTRITDAGVAVWTKTYLLNFDESTMDVDATISLKPVGDNVLVTFEQQTPIHSRGIGFILIDEDGLVIRHRVLSADGNSIYNYYEWPTPNFADIYTDQYGDHLVSAVYTYIPTDNYYNALLFRLPIDGLKDIAVNDPYSIGECILNRFNVNVTTMTSAFESFTPTVHTNTITNVTETRNYVSRVPDSLLQVWTTKITDDSAGYVEFGDGSKQSFATNIIPQIATANDYYLTEQDSGKHIFFEYENGTVYIPHWMDKNLPVGFTFTIVNTSGSDCYVETLNSRSGGLDGAALKLAGRNIETYTIGIPDSGSGSAVTFLKVKHGYTMPNSDGPGEYRDVWIVSGPGDIYNAD